MTGSLMPGDIPMTVTAARIASDRLGFKGSCSDEVGRLLQVLAAQFSNAQIGEIGAGCGVGTAWLASGLAPGASLITIDTQPEAVAAVRMQFGDHGAVEVLEGNWQLILQRGPFAMLFVDVSEAKGAGAEDVIDALAIGGLAIIDDLTPVAQWPEEWHGKPDPIRERWLENPRMRAVEVLVTPSSAVILATRWR